VAADGTVVTQVDAFIEEVADFSKEDLTVNIHPGAPPDDFDDVARVRERSQRGAADARAAGASTRPLFGTPQALPV
jgi:hypothetical protein